MRTLHVISHTHWDREWYQPFQLLRLRLIHLVDGLLDLLENDPDFKYFMLDGQTIVLEDYLALRPEREAILREHIQKGRILIGPWHILPDMFLVGPEAHIRNLLQGDRTARRFGPKMPVGYIPDPFGHPGQIPQILRGFGIEAACVWRGLDEQPVEFWWQSPDGSRVFMAYLRDSYFNGAWLRPEDTLEFAESISALGDSLAAHSAASDYLIMLGTDHMEPPPHTSKAIAYADRMLADTRVIHSTLPQYITAVRASVDAGQLPVVAGELRASKRMHLLPGVLSTRIWIKQRNHASENLLTKWAEPFAAFQELTSGGNQYPAGTMSEILNRKSEIIHQAWRLLMENHPHDSICGCSIDQVHDEMKTRFDQVDQIGEELVRQSLNAIAAAVSTNGQAAALKAIIVFNPSGFSRSDSVSVEINLPPEVGAFEIVDELGNVLPHETTSAGAKELVNLVLDPKGLRHTFPAIHDGMVANLGVRSFSIRRDEGLVHVNIIMSKGTPNKDVWERGVREILALLDDPTITGYHVRASLGDTVQAVFSAPAIPGLGWRTFYVRAKEGSAPLVALNPFVRALLPLASRFIAGTSIGRSLISRMQRDPCDQPPYRIENEFFIVEVEPQGTLRITDKRNGAVYRDLNRFVDGGDCGDEYNYSPPDSDTPRPLPRLTGVSVQCRRALQTLTLTLAFDIPSRLNRNRKSRVAREKYFVPMPIVCRVRLAAGVPRVDVHTTVENNAQDHRLRVHFPTPFETDSADYDGHFEIVRRKIGVPEFDRKTWVEDPRPEVPQRAFTDVSDGQVGLMLANRGLPEVEALKTDRGAEIALTLLRCVGWLSRDDFQTRRGQAGPEEATPGAQMIGKWAFDYSIIPHGKDQPYELAYGFDVPLRAVSTSIHTGSLPARGAFVSIVGGDGFIVSAVKKAESGAGWIMRGYNITGEDIRVTLRFWKRFSQAARVNLAEQKIADLQPEKESGDVTFPVKGHEIVTIWYNE
jgi:alpha-mannosidase